PAPRVDVVRVPDLAAEQAAQAGLLLDLAAGCLRIELARLELALGKRPVVVRRPVDEQDLEPAGCPTHDESARGANEPAHAGDRRCPAASAFQALRQLPRASSAAARSRPASSPAANRARGERRPAPHSRSHRSATTASFSSPSTSWSSAA